MNPWPVLPLSEIADQCLGKMLDKSKNRGTLRPYLPNINVRWFHFDLADLLEMRFEITRPERYTARKGDLIICEADTLVGRRFGHMTNLYICKRRFTGFGLRSQNALNGFCICFGSQIRTGLSRTDLPVVGYSTLRGRFLGYFRFQPPLPEQERIVAVLDEALAGISAAVTNAEKKLTHLAELKQVILQKAFAGELSASSIRSVSKAAE